MQRVFITGIGSVTSFGVGNDKLYQGLLQGTPPAAAIPSFWKAICDTRSEVYIPFSLDSLEIDCVISTVEKLQYDPVSICGIQATWEALVNAGLAPELQESKQKKYLVEAFRTKKAGTIMGTGVGGITTLIENAFFYYFGKLRASLNELQPEVESEYFPFPQRNLNKFTVPRMMPNSLADVVAMKFGACQFVDTVCQACSSSTTSIGRGFERIQRGLADIMLVGGSEYLEIPYFGGFHKGFDIAGTLALGSSDNLSGPFDQNRSGFLFSNGGAASLILESEQSVLERGVEPLAEIMGFSENFENHSLMALDPTGKYIKAIHSELLQIGSINSTKIDYINAHGTGTQNNDAIEAAALQEIYGDVPAVNSSKGILGHTIGASGAIEAVATILQMKNGMVHGNANLKHPITGLNLPQTPQKTRINLAVTTSFAFGGHNAGLLLSTP